MPARKVWILSFGGLEGPLLGPTLRVIQMARMAREQGHEVMLAFESGVDGEFEGMRVRKLVPGLVAEIGEGDAVVASAMLHPAVLWALLRSRRAFDVDLYGLPVLEHIEIQHSRSPLSVYRSRRRMRLRFRILAEHCDRIYLSNSNQLSFLGGMLFSEGDYGSCTLASRLAGKTLFLPMGVGGHGEPSGSDPYPPAFQGRPVFLWGGGIWSWFDMETLLKAFELLAWKDSKAALYFICGSNPSGLGTQDEPVARTRSLALRLGLLGKNVEFHDGPVDPGNLPSYLAHCAAGVMSNPLRLESYGSWRTRLLDMPAFGKPVVVAGFDPLARRLKALGAALTVPSGDVEGFAAAVERLCDPTEREEFERGAMRAASTLAWKTTFEPWLNRLDDDESFRAREPRRPDLRRLLLYVLGI